MAESEDHLTGNPPTAPYSGAAHPADPAARSAAIQHDIERTRSQMDQTLGELEERLTPSRLLDESWELVKDRSARGASRAWELAREHPLPALTVGVGLGWLIFESRHGGRLRGGNGRELVRNAGGKLRRAKRRAGQAVDDLGDRASDAAGVVKRQARQIGRLGGRLRERTARATSELGDFVEERPLAAGAATLALGLLAGLALPSTRREDEWLGEKRDELLEEIKETGREALEKGRELAQEAVETLKEELDEHRVIRQRGAAGTGAGSGVGAGFDRAAGPGAGVGVGTASAGTGAGMGAGSGTGARFGATTGAATSTGVGGGTSAGATTSPAGASPDSVLWRPASPSPSGVPGAPGTREPR